jgi:hypothetical protein
MARACNLQRHTSSSHGWLIYLRDLPEPMFGSVHAAVQQRTRQSIWIILGDTAGSKRIQRGDTRPNGHPLHSPKHQQNQSNSIGERGSSVGLPGCTKAGHLSPSIAYSLTMLPFGYIEDYHGALPRPLIHNTLLAHQGAPRQSDIVQQAEQKSSTQLHLQSCDEATDSSGWSRQHNNM